MLPAFTHANDLSKEGSQSVHGLSCTTLSYSDVQKGRFSHRQKKGYNSPFTEGQLEGVALVIRRINYEKSFHTPRKSVQASHFSAVHQRRRASGTLGSPLSSA